MPEINPTFLSQQGMVQSLNPLEKSVTPHNLVNITTAEEVGKIAKKEIGTRPYRIATAGYSAPPSGYEDVIKQFLKKLDSELGTRSSAFITSPSVIFVCKFKIGISLL